MSDELRHWLDQIGLAQHAETFAANDIDLDVLPELSDEDLKELGLSLGDRRRLQRALSKRTSEDAISAAPETPTRDAERRQLTVLFCDLVGSTELSRRFDPEDLRELIRRCQDAVSGAVVRQGGYVANFLGDGIIAYFGWPHADEDNAAQRCAPASMRLSRSANWRCRRMRGSLPVLSWSAISILPGAARQAPSPARRRTSQRG
jgi:class 3 adenylate cyclase